MAGFRQAVLVGTKSVDGHTNLYQKAHQTSARYDKGISEFEQVGFDETYDPTCYAPFVQDAVVKIAMKFEEIIPIPLNGTILIIGSIMHVDIGDSLVGNDGYVPLSEADINQPGA